MIIVDVHDGNAGPARPRLTSADSLGLYLTWKPRLDTVDSERNCISNVRASGLDHAAAGTRLLYLIRESHHLGVSGILLKDESPDAIVQVLPAKPSSERTL